MTRILVLIVIAVVGWDAGLAQAPKAAPGERKLDSLPKAEVVRIIDGDTIELRLGGTVERCRLLGVDTPELKADSAENTFYGREAAWFTYNLLAGESVWVETDPRELRDNYGRMLAFVYRVPDGMFVNLELVRQGYARIYRNYDNPYKKIFVEYEQRAQSAKKGLWNPNLAKKAEEEKKNAETTQTAGGKSAGAAGAAKAVASGVAAGAAGADSTMVYATKSGTKYHRAGCRSLRKGGNPIAVSAAKAKGLTACAVCKP